MATYRITTVQNLPNRNPSRFQVRYEFNGAPTQTWWLENVNPDRDVAAFNADCGTDLINQQNVRTRTVIVHYPDAPNTEERQVSSVQRP